MRQFTTLANAGCSTGEQDQTDLGLMIFTSTIVSTLTVYIVKQGNIKTKVGSESVQGNNMGQGINLTAYIGDRVGKLSLRHQGRKSRQVQHAD